MKTVPPPEPKFRPETSFQEVSPTRKPTFDEKHPRAGQIFHVVMMTLFLFVFIGSFTVIFFLRSGTRFHPVILLILGTTCGVMWFRRLTKK